MSGHESRSGSVGGGIEMMADDDLAFQRWLEREMTDKQPHVSDSGRESANRDAGPDFRRLSENPRPPAVDKVALGELLFAEIGSSLVVDRLIHEIFASGILTDADADELRREALQERMTGWSEDTVLLEEAEAELAELRAAVEAVPSSVDGSTEWLNRRLVLEAIDDPDSKFLAAAREHARNEIRAAIEAVLDERFMSMSGTLKRIRALLAEKASE